MNPITIKPPKSANHELSVVLACADPVKTDDDDAEVIGAVSVTPIVVAPGRTQVHVFVGGQLVGPTVPTHVVVWPVQVSIGQIVKVGSMRVVSPGEVFAFKYCPSVMPTDERDHQNLFNYGLKCPRCNLRDVLVTEEEAEPSLEEEVELELELELEPEPELELELELVLELELEDTVKAKHGALLVYCSQSPVKAMPAFRMVW